MPESIDYVKRNISQNNSKSDLGQHVWDSSLIRKCSKEILSKTSERDVF